MYQGKNKEKHNRDSIIPALAVCFVLVWKVFPVSADVYDSGKKRDPFVPLVGVKSEKVSLGDTIFSVDDIMLQGIVVGTDGRYSAIINGEVMKEGDKTSQIEVESITENTVTIVINREKYTVSLYDE